MVIFSVHEHWQLIEGNSLKAIPGLKETVYFYSHGSDHSMNFLSRELAAAWEKLYDRALILVHDSDWSNAFFTFCVERR